MCLAEGYRLTRREEVGDGHFAVLPEEFHVRHRALRQQGSPVSLTDIFCNASVFVCVWIRFRLLLLAACRVQDDIFCLLSEEDHQLFASAACFQVRLIFSSHSKLYLLINSRIHFNKKKDKLFLVNES